MTSTIKMNYASSRIINFFAITINFNSFSSMNLMLWAVVAMCYSKYFREMTDKEFIFWVRSIFDRRYRKVITVKGINEG